MGCQGCTLMSDQLTTPQMKPTGSKHPTIYTIGEAPGADEDSEGRQFVGKSGKILRKELETVFEDTKSFRWNNTCRCRPPSNRTPEIVEREHCRNSVTEDIEATKPKVVLGVGAVALQWATGEASIAKWHGRMMPVKVGNHVCWFYLILHPAFVMRQCCY